MDTKVEQRSTKNKREDKEKDSSSYSKEHKKKKYSFIYGNYHSYYGYRLGQALNEDPRMKVVRKEWFEGKDCLDIGCNEGFITISIAQKFACRSILGIDIDDRLIFKARQLLKAAEGTERHEKSGEEKSTVNKKNEINRTWQSNEDKDLLNGLKSTNRMEESQECDLRGNVDGKKQFQLDEKRTNKLAVCDKKTSRDRITTFSRDSESDDVEGTVKNHGLLERVCFRTENFIRAFPAEVDAVYDTVLCLSVTKWVHLNWGDKGLIRLFAKIWQVLKPGGILVLEPQPWRSYEKKYLVSEVAAENFHDIVYKPEHFSDILLDKIGFRSMENISAHVPNSTVGFDRPMYLLIK